MLSKNIYSEQISLIRPSIFCSEHNDTFGYILFRMFRPVYLKNEYSPFLTDDGELQILKELRVLFDVTDT